GTAFLATSAPMAIAQVTPAAQVTVPEANPAFGFADLVDAVKPAVVSIIVEGRDTPSRSLGDQFDPRFPDLPEDNPLRKFFEQFGGPPSSGERPRRGDRENSQGEAPQGRKFVAAGSGFAIS